MMRLATLVPILASVGQAALASPDPVRAEQLSRHYLARRAQLMALAGQPVPFHRFNAGGPAASSHPHMRDGSCVTGGLPV